ncbi:MAG: hypothetical protein LBT59_31160 [Clostridiales bacterium]|nr:hypothetical protein [Clostridiales bacterium]
MPNEVFDLKSFCAIMKKCGFSHDCVAKDIFGGCLGSSSSFSRVVNYHKNLSLNTLLEAQKHIDLYADNLAVIFAKNDEQQYSKRLKISCYTLFVQGLKGSPLFSKVKIDDPSQLPVNISERTKVYRDLAFEVILEAVSTTITTAYEKLSPENNGLSEQSVADLPKNTNSESSIIASPSVVEPKASSMQNVINSISNFTKDEKKTVFNFLIQDMRGEYLSEFEQDLYYTFVKDYLLNSINHTYIETFSRTDEILISKDNSLITKWISRDFLLISDHPDKLSQSFDVNHMYTGDITDLRDINTPSRFDDRLSLFKTTYNNFELTINDIKVDDVFQYFKINNDPEKFKILQGFRRNLKTSIDISELLRSYNTNEFKIVTKSSRQSPVLSNVIYLLIRFNNPVKKYCLSCVLKEDTSINWQIAMLPILPGYFINTSNKYSDNNFLELVEAENSKSIFIANWVTPGFGILYDITRKHPLPANS